MGILSNLASVGRRVDRVRDTMCKLDIKLYDACKSELDAFEHRYLKKVVQLEVLGPNDNEVSIGQKEGKIPAVKAFRERTGAGIADAKIAMENYFNEHGLYFYLPTVPVNSDNRY